MSSSRPDENLLLYVNISGELFYIVVHRMEVQGIEPQLQSTVAHQLIMAIASPEVVNDLVSGQLRFADQPMEVMRSALKEMVDGTIMKINDFSMEKLFELTLIATKYQYTVCAHPKDILLIALNHLDTMRGHAEERGAVDLMSSLHLVLVESYGSKGRREMAAYQWSVLHYVQDIKLKMTNLVNLGLQDVNGDFVRQEDEHLAYPEDDEDSNLEKGILVEASERRRMHSLALKGDRVIKLGLSIYDQKIQRNNKMPSAPSSLPTASGGDTSLQFCNDEVRAVQGLDFCSALLGAPRDSSDSKRSTPSEKTQDSALARFQRQDSTQTIRIDASVAATNSTLLEIGKRLEATELDEGHKKRDISELMDLFAD